MHYRDVLKNCAAILGDRDKKYGDSDACFTRIAKIASIVLDRPISTYDVAIILSCVKLGRIPGDPAYADNYVDLANYAAFSAHFAGADAEQPVRLSDEAFEVVLNPAERAASVHAFSGSSRARPQKLDASAFLNALNSVEEDVIEKQPGKALS